MTFNSDETGAVRNQFLDRPLTPCPLTEGYACDSYGILNGMEIVHCVCGIQGNDSSQLNCSQLIKGLGQRLKAVIAVGMAYGTDEEKHDSTTGEKIGEGRQLLGDMLVSEAIFDYRTSKLTPPAPLGFIQHFKHQAMIRKIEAGSIWEKVHFGVLLSGGYVDKATERDAFIKKCPDRVIGGEMEGLGISTAVSGAETKIDWIIVKGISGWGDEEDKKMGSAVKKAAAENAARVVHEVLSSSAPLYNASGKRDIRAVRPHLKNLDKARERGKKEFEWEGASPDGKREQLPVEAFGFSGED